jgi:hypothetical protein
MPELPSVMRLGDERNPAALQHQSAACHRTASAFHLPFRGGGVEKRRMQPGVGSAAGAEGGHGRR